MPVNPSCAVATTSPRPILALALGAAWSLLAPGCFAPPVRVEPRSEQALHRDLDTCALQADAPSAWTAWALTLLEAEENYERDPVATLRSLHAWFAEQDGGEGLFALAELSYLAGARLNDSSCFLAAAVYAHLFLVGEKDAVRPSPYDRRFRWACDIYNRSLVRALKSPEGGSLRLEPGRRELPAGSLQMQVDLSHFPFETEGLELLAADELEVIGLEFRMRDSGLGAPLIAVVQRRGEGTAGVGIQDRTNVPATLFLRVHGSFRDLQAGLSAELELYSTYDATWIELGGGPVPLESDPSATLAYALEVADLWEFDIAGFFRGRDAMRQNGLILPRPFQAGRIPVVLVHGTASNPAYWAELLNSLQADPLIRSRVQFWLFIYTSGNPVVYSAASLREDLAAMVQARDPEGRNPFLRNMVVVGHSQGGLLTKLTAVHLDADEVLRRLLGTSLGELHLDEKDGQLVQRCFDVEPLPFVSRVVFVATPHRGSFLAARWFSRLLAKLIAVPGELVGLTQRVVGRVPDERLPAEIRERVPTSLDNMNPGHPFLKILAETPIDPRIPAHSIIPIGDATEPAGADDGVVEYESAHIAGVESELLVPCGHSCQGHPRTLIEMRRILREHIQAVDAGLNRAP